MQAKSDVAVVSKDIDVLVLLRLYSQLDVHSKLYMMFDHNSYADISLIVEHFVSNTPQIFPTIHPITQAGHQCTSDIPFWIHTRYDITSYFFWIWENKSNLKYFLKKH